MTGSSDALESESPKHTGIKNIANSARQTPSRSGFLPWLTVALTLLILAAAVLLVTLHLRKAMRVQLIQQDGIALYAASLVPSSADDELDAESASDPLIRSEFSRAI